MHMHPFVSYELTQARIAELHRQADRDAIVRAARQARGARKFATSSQRPHWAAEAGRRFQAVLIAATAELRRRVLAAPAPSAKQ